MKITLNPQEVNKALTEYMNKNFQSYDHDIEVLQFSVGNDNSEVNAVIGVCKIVHEEVKPMIHPGNIAPCAAPAKKADPVW